jgi:hypothetical protein
MSKVVRLSSFRSKSNQRVYFTRCELNQLLSIYSRRVIGGEWKDYAIDQGKGMSAFSIYRDSSNRPAFTVYKFANGSHRKGNYVVGSGGNILQRGRTLDEALSVLKTNLRLVN